MITRRTFLTGSTCAVVVGALGGYSTFIEPEWLEVTHRKLPRQMLGLSRGLRIVQLSDLHICRHLDAEYFRESFRRADELKADVVVYTGDFITNVEGWMKMLGELVPFFPKGRLGTFAALGNHDFGAGFKDHGTSLRIEAALSKGGITVLRNRSERVGDLTLVGLDDLWSGSQDIAAAFASVDAGVRSLILNHNPDTVDERGFEGVKGLVLSGHTHGGQVKPPFLPPPILPVKNKRYTSGMFSLSDGLSLYINRGLGFIRKVRFNCRPEITCLDFV